jgi:hypothetical protein
MRIELIKAAEPKKLDPKTLEMTTVRDRGVNCTKKGVWKCPSDMPE